ncbi:MAG TPA: cell wall-binding protein, partial [Clostridium sp.]|nr:cell wall-binding protein [Clostridium sp.]
SNNIIVWNTDDDRYTIYSNKTKNAESNLENTIELGKSQYGWIHNQDGTWSYLLEDSTKKVGWLLDNSKWYYLNSDGIMKTGWLNINENWYYLNSDGSMRTGWLNENEKWYYLDSTGAMLSNTTVDGYMLNNSGEWIS